MKGIIKLALFASVLLGVEAAKAHQTIAVAQMRSQTGTGYNAKKLVWHDDDYHEAQPYQGITNHGPWAIYPVDQARLLPADGWMGPISVNRWYKVKFSSFILSDWSAIVFANPDICSPTTPRKRQL